VRSTTAAEAKEEAKRASSCKQKHEKLHLLTG